MPDNPNKLAMMQRRGSPVVLQHRDHLAGLLNRSDDRRRSLVQGLHRGSQPYRHRVRAEC
ncbi:hypothetical protein [Bradyrhizobium sp. BR 10289]|uniref:hypothetical protein n=1 Tax=Bradyrhizobium sp. BR 10289 TaxID=2749993 RepID=UPI001C650DA4|nr:hypothetical protein [Bradyrhizobium sp. BR 10289]MBW7969434.1 hypothetical protein [Bradyrhizobium sp. BR 10289]